MLKRFIYVTALLFAALSVDAKQPNIVYIMVDDMGYADIGAFGSKAVKTPNLDKLAADGMVFHRRLRRLHRLRADALDAHDRLPHGQRLHAPQYRRRPNPRRRGHGR
jgi:hypothetical protein